MSLRRLGAAVAACVCTAALASCSLGVEPEASASSTPSASPATTISPVAAPSPSTSVTSEAVATDDPVTVPSPTSSTESIEVDLLLSFWGVTDSGIEAAAFVDGLVTSEGTCVLHATRGDLERTATALSLADARSSTCARGMLVPNEDLESGAWNLWITFEDDHYVGQTERVEVDVP